MNIYHYDRRTGKGLVNGTEQAYPWVCAFYVPDNFKYKEMENWVTENYEPEDYIGCVQYGELFFARPEHAAWFMMRWA